MAMLKKVASFNAGKRGLAVMTKVASMYRIRECGYGFRHWGGSFV